MSNTDQIKDFLAQPHRWQWGECDCTTFVGLWATFRTGLVPGASIRGTYATREEALAIVARHGGIARFCGAVLEPCGFRPVQQPIDGDIGIVRSRMGIDVDGTYEGLIPGIAFGPLWAVMSPRGPIVKKLDFAGQAWRIA